MLDDSTAEDLHANQRRLIEAYSQLIGRLRFHSESDAEDIIQEACIRALGVTRPDLIKNPIRYLLKIYRNLFINNQHRKRREAEIFDRTVDPSVTERTAATYIDAERILIGKEEIIIAYLAVEDLPARFREALKLRRVEGLSHAAIAQRMGITPKTVEHYLAGAIKKLTEALDIIQSSQVTGPELGRGKNDKR